MKQTSTLPTNRVRFSLNHGQVSTRDEGTEV